MSLADSKMLLRNYTDKKCKFWQNLSTLGRGAVNHEESLFEPFGIGPGGKYTKIDVAPKVAITDMETEE